MDLGLGGRVALVTAASRGLGLASALALASEGANVVISARGEDRLAEAEKELIEAGRTSPAGKVEVMSVVGDVTRPEVPGQLAAAAARQFGQLDILVANAGGPPPGRALEIGEEALSAALNANLRASVRLVGACVPHMRRRGWGRICCISSYSIKQALAALALSNTARAGLWAWAKTAAADLAPEGITLNLACPGPHATDRMLELGGGGPMGDPSDFGKVVAFLCSEPAAFVNGAAVVVDGGATLAL